MSMFPKNSLFQREAFPIDVFVPIPETARVTMTRALAHITSEVEDCLELFESGQPRDHEEAIGRLDNVARELREVLHSR